MHYIKLLLLLTVTSLFLSRCGSNSEPVKADTDKYKYFPVFKSAEVLVFEQLPDTIKADLNRYGNFITDSAYFVKAKLNNLNLATICESKTFSIHDLLSDNPHSLYGKYHNRWKCLNSKGDQICENDKFEGFRMLQLKRDGYTDEVIIGPMNEKPATLIIEAYDSKDFVDAQSRIEL